jgi:cyanophycin synthetase
VEELADGAYEFKLGDLTRRIRRGPILDLENAFTYWLCGNKYATYEILRKYGFKKVPYYRRYSLGTIREARRDFTTRKRAVVIKPCFGTSRGKGVTVDIRDVRKLNGAIYNSLMYDGTFLMEDFIEGGNFRILFYKDRMLDAFQRVPANVKGDGINNIKSLIRIENERRVKQQSPIPLYPIEIDDDVKRCLHRQDISLKSVPEKDEVVYVRTAINYRTGGEMKDVKTMVHEDIVSDCRSIMKIMDITLGGIDIITRNIDRPLAETGGAINEVNTSPGLIVHDNDVIKNILNLMFEREC